MPAPKQEKKFNYPKVGLKDVLSAFWNGIRPHKWLLFILSGSVVAGNVVVTIVPIFYKQFFDVIYAGGDKADIASQLIWIIFYILGLNGVFWIFYRVATIANNNYEPKVMANLKQQAYDHLMLHSYSFFANNFAGSLVQKINRFARAFERITDDLIWNLLPLAVKVISIFTVVFFINRWMALIILIWTVVFLSFNVIFSRWKIKYDVKAASIDSVATGYLADTISNQNTVQLFGGFKRESQGYKNVTNEQAKTTVFAWNLDAVIEGVQSFLSLLIEFILFYFAIKYWQEGLITIGVFVLLQIYVIDLIDQLWGFTRLIKTIYQSYADSKEVVEITRLPHEIKDVPAAKELFVEKGGIVFENLTFSFSGTREVLKDINLEIKPGEKVALIGPSGSGKSTLVRLLLRFYTPTGGKILIDREDVSKVTQESLRKNVSIVPQDPVLFHRTLAENIAYGKPDAPRQEIERAAELAHCDEFIKDLPYGLQTHVGERGVKLSGGERQRVAIARAILKNAPILVLDEATSSLDSNSEALIQDALNVLMKDKTTIVIAHRLSTIQKMDRIIVIENGIIIEQGKHRELLRKKESLYRKLWTLQAGGFLQPEEDEEEPLPPPPENPVQEAQEEDEGDDSDEGPKGEAKLVNF